MRYFIKMHCRSHLTAMFHRAKFRVSISHFTCFITLPSSVTFRSIMSKVRHPFAKRFLQGFQVFLLCKIFSFDNSDQILSCDIFTSGKPFGNVEWLVGCFEFNVPLRQYFSLYRAASRKRRERIDESKIVQTTPTRTYCKHNRPLPYYHPNCRTPRHWKFTQYHRTTRPPFRKC